MINLNRDQRFNMDMTYREEVLSKISSLIESKYGRLKPTICDYSNFEKNKDIIEGEIKSKKHFNEKDWPDCVKVFLDSFKTLKHMVLENVSSDNDSDYNNARELG